MLHSWILFICTLGQILIVAWAAYVLGAQSPISPKPLISPQIRSLQSSPTSTLIVSMWKLLHYTDSPTPVYVPLRNRSPYDLLSRVSTLTFVAGLAPC